MAECLFSWTDEGYSATAECLKLPSVQSLDLCRELSFSGSGVHFLSWQQITPVARTCLVATFLRANQQRGEVYRFQSSEIDQT